MKQLLICVLVLCLLLCAVSAFAENAGTDMIFGSNEILCGLLQTDTVIAAVVENETHMRCIRVAQMKPDGEWLLQSSRWMTVPLWINEYHSNEEWIELEYEWAGSYISVFLAPGEDGYWRLCSLDGYYLEQGQPYAVEAINFHPATNDDFHYGSLTVSLALSDLNLDLLPPVSGSITEILDPGSWACVANEGATLYDAPDGAVIANCSCRLAGLVMERTDNWTCLKISSETDGMKGWFRTDDLAFGDETEQVICSFPSYDEDVFDELDIAFPDLNIETDSYSTWLWLIGRCVDGRWLVQVNADTVVYAEASLFSGIGPAEHEWDEMSDEEETQKVYAANPPVPVYSMDDIYCMRQSAGNEAYYTFYDAIHGRVSPVYQNVIDARGETVLYTGWYEDSWHLILSSIFTGEVLRTQPIDLESALGRVEGAEWSETEQAWYVTYLSGEAYTETTVVFSENNGLKD